VSAKKRAPAKPSWFVDDHAAIRKMLAAAFLSDGFKTCAEAENGKEAVEAAKQIKPGVVTLDLSMPVVDGLRAASELRRVFPTTPDNSVHSIRRFSAERIGGWLTPKSIANLPQRLIFR